MKTTIQPPHVHCRRCNGTGRAPLTPDLWRTLKLLRKLGRGLACDMQEKGVISTAINNRLVALEAQGLAKRAGKTGKWIEWEAVTP